MTAASAPRPMIPHHKTTAKFGLRLMRAINPPSTIQMASFTIIHGSKLFPYNLAIKPNPATIMRMRPMPLVIEPSFLTFASSLPAILRPSRAP